MYDCEALIVPGEGAEFLPRHFNGKFDLHQRAYALFDFSQRVDVKFLSYFMHHSKGYFPSVAVGATVKSLRRRHFVDMPIALTNLAAQRRIVSILDEAFAGIATAKENAEKNLQNARALFESHLRASLTARDDSWKPKTLVDVCSITSALIDPRDDQFSGLLHVGAGNMVSGVGELLGLQTAKEEGLISGKFPFDTSMVLYSKIRPYLLKVARPDFAGLCSADVYPLAPLPGRMDRDFLFYLLRGPAFTEYAISGSARAGMPKVNREHLFAFQTFLPSVEQQAVIARKLDMLADEVKQVVAICQRKLAALDELKQSLLAKAFAGELC